MIEQELLIKPDETLSRDVILGLRGTKALDVAIPTLDKYSVVTTWSSLVRKVVEWLSDSMTTMLLVKGEEAFSNKYIDIFNRRLETANIRLNSNCPVGIFKDDEIDEFISSSVYLNNQNHKLKLFDFEGHSWSVCAVYTGEIIFVLSTLIEMIDEFRCNNALITGDTSKLEPIVIQITYRDRTDTEVADDIVNDMAIKGIDSVINNNALERNLIENSMQIKDLITSLYDVAISMHLDTAQRIMEDIFTKDLVEKIKMLKQNNTK